MRFSLSIFFLLGTFLLNAQEENSAESSCSQILKGEIRDQITTDILPGAEAVLSDVNGTILEAQIVKEDGAFSFKIKCGTTYKIEGSKPDFTAEEKSFTTTTENRKELKIIILLDKGNIDFVSDSEANAKAIDTIAKAEIVTQEVAPEIVVEKIEESAVKNKVDAVATEREESKAETVKQKTLVKIDPVYFDYESSWLNQKAKNELQKVIALMKQNPKMIVKCAGYTDSKGTEKYNMWMSKRRAKRVVDYMIEQGIRASRISGEGYGETNLVNECTNDVECTDEQRAANRRTEFVIVKM